MNSSPAGRADGFRQVIVAEPTRCRAEFRHRGFLSARGQFRGISGHSSEPRALADNAIHRLSRWSAAAVREAEIAAESGQSHLFQHRHGEPAASNPISSPTRPRCSGAPGCHPAKATMPFCSTWSAWQGGEQARWVVSFSGPPLPTAGHDDTPGARVRRAPWLSLR